MISDDERRAVARRLRGNAAQDMGWLIPWAVFNDAEQHAGEAVVRRLADLIEPSESGQNRDRNQDTVQKESPVVQIEHECDRDALLALADEMTVEKGDIWRWSSRIRKALGVVE